MFLINIKLNKRVLNAVDDCVVVLKFVPDWFVTSKMIKQVFTGLYAG